MATLNERALEIQKKAQSLKDTTPVHLKLLPEIRQTLALINEISDVLVQLTHTPGEHHANH